MKKRFLSGILLVGILVSCEKSQTVNEEEFTVAKAKASLPSITTMPELEFDSEVVLFSAEYITTGENGAVGNTIFFGEFDKGNKQLESDFVPGDPRLGGFSNIFYAFDEAEATATNQGAGLSPAQTEAAIDRAMATWDGVNCSDLGITKIDGVTGIGQVQEFFQDPANFSGFAIIELPVILHSGILPGSFFDQVAPGGSEFILGVTYTLVFTDSDIDNNGKSDVAIKEVYYNDNFNWNEGTTYDLETVALHESGHALSQAHFGKAFLTESNDKVHFAPRAVMNASYSGVQTEIKKTDKAGHCSNWSQWPNN